MARGSKERQSGLQKARPGGRFPPAARIKTATHTMKARFLILLPLLASAVSCSIKEDRTPCPCWLDIDVSLCSRQGETVSLRGWNSTKPLFGETLYVADWPDVWETPVPKGVVHYTAYSGVRSCMASGSTLLVPEGNQCDSLWAYRTSVICEGEDAFDRVNLHKQFATVTMKLTQEPDGVLSALITGPWAGMSLDDLGAVKGDYSYTAGQNAEGLFVFRLPRQGDGSLVFELLRDGHRYETFALGELIEKTGYDWNAQDLDDIFIGVDFYRGEISIGIGDWEEDAIYTIEL